MTKADDPGVCMVSCHLSSTIDPPDIFSFENVTQSVWLLGHAHFQSQTRIGFFPLMSHNVLLRFVFIYIIIMGRFTKREVLAHT